jgi:hypothetical protein
MAEIQDMHGKLRELSSEAEKHASALGAKCTQTLRILARGAGRVVVTGTRRRQDERRDVARDYVDRVTIQLGTIRGLAIFAEHRYREIRVDLKRIADAYRAAESMNADTSTKELVATAAAISDLPRTIAQGLVLVSALQDFEESDWNLLPFLVGDAGERYKIARISLSRGGQLVGKDRAKEWLREREAEIRRVNGLERLEIAY